MSRAWGKKIKKEIGKDLWSLLFRTVIILIGAFVYVIQNKFGLRFFQIDPIVSALTITLLGFSWTQTISASFHRDEIKNEVMSINKGIDLLNSAVDLRIYENFSDCNSYINSQIIKAVDVRNMCVITCSIDDYRNYTRLNKNEILNIVSGFFQRTGRWHDIFSDTAKGRASLIRSKIGKNNNYHARVVIKDMPILNFIIITYGRNDKELFFGFGLHKTAAEDHIYASKNHYLVETFKRYYDAVMHKDYSKEI